MKTYIVCTDGQIPAERKPFTNIYDNHYAERFIRHLSDDATLCTGCGQNCISCRLSYKIDFAPQIAGTLIIPSELLYYIDTPESFLPRKLPGHEILIAINIHEDILLALPPRAKKAGAKALIVPIEDPDWLSKWARNRLAQVCAKIGLEFAAPKPFCSLDFNSFHPHINRFIKYYRIGKPELKIKLHNKKISGAKVITSAPCGDTYFVAHNLKGVSVDSKIHEVVSKYWHSYPCTASMKMDYELGDTILHKGGYLHYEAVDNAIEEARQNKALKLQDVNHK